MFFSRRRHITLFLGFVLVADVTAVADESDVSGNKRNRSGDESNLSGDAASVAINFDRGKITSATCSKHNDTAWCPHIVQAVYHRIDFPSNFEYRLPISYSIQELSAIQRMQFLCRFLNRLQPNCLGIAQTVLDEFLASKENLQEVQGCIDSTAGGAIGNEPEWSFEVTAEDEEPDAVGRCFVGRPKNSTIKSWKWLVGEVEKCLFREPGRYS